MNEAIIGLVGVLVGSFITVLKDFWTSYRERCKDGSYAAIRLISIRESYADRCVDVVQDGGTIHGQPARRLPDGQEYLEAQEAIPDPPDYPDDIVWRSLDEPLMHRILALPNKARRTNRYISSAFDNACPPDFDEYFEARQEGYAGLGIEALIISSELRKTFRVSANSGIHMATEWDPLTFLSTTIEIFDRERAESQKRRPEANKEIAI